MESIIKLEGEVTGTYGVVSVLNKTPKVMASFYLRALGKERSLFVGNPSRKGALGSFNRPLTRRSLWGGRVSRYSNMWSVQFARMFRGKIYGGEPLEGITLEMGMSNTSKIRPIAEKLQRGGSISGPMVVPNYRNLASLGVFPKLGGSGRELSRLVKDGSVFSRRIGGKTYWFDKEKFKVSPRQALLFVVSGKVDLRPQFNFPAAWRVQEPNAKVRIRKAIDDAVHAINTGRYKS